MGNRIDSVVRDATVVRVSTRPVGAQNRQLWEIETQDGTKWTTFKSDLGNKALGMQGTTADLQVTIEHNDKGYVNYYLNAIQAGNGVQTPVAQAIQAAQAAAPTQEVSYDTYKSLEGEKTQSIHRQVAAKVAATLHEPGETALDFWANVEAIYHYFQTGQTPDKAAHDAMAKTNVTSHVASDVPPAHTDDDIPF